MTSLKVVRTIRYVFLPLLCPVLMACNDGSIAASISGSAKALNSNSGTSCQTVLDDNGSLTMTCNNGMTITAPMSALTQFKGDKGDSGAAGTNGVDGVQGAKGNTGAAGAQGLQGAVGATGPQGVAGTNGAQGVQGLTGAKGETGAAGINGTSGAAGATGPQGVQGQAGAAGSNGTNGLQIQLRKADNTVVSDSVLSIVANDNTLSPFVTAYDATHSAYATYNALGNIAVPGAINGTIYFTGLNCTGTAYLNQSLPDGYIYAGYQTSGDNTGVSMVTKSGISIITGGICTNANVTLGYHVRLVAYPGTLPMSIGSGWKTSQL